MGVEMQSVIPVEQMKGEDAEENKLLSESLELAREYLSSFKWCRKILESHFGLGAGDLVAVFLFRIEPTGGASEWVWIVVGDLPPAYVDTEGASTPNAALDVYCNLMEDWCEAVRTKGDLEQVFPVEADPTEENASELEERIEYLRTEVIPHPPR